MTNWDIPSFLQGFPLQRCFQRWVGVLEFCPSRGILHLFRLLFAGSFVILFSRKVQQMLLSLCKLCFLLCFHFVHHKIKSDWNWHHFLIFTLIFHSTLRTANTTVVQRPTTVLRALKICNKCCIYPTRNTFTEVQCHLHLLLCNNSCQKLFDSLNVQSHCGTWQ